MSKIDYGIDFQLDTLKMAVDNLSFLLLLKKYTKKEFFSTDRLQFLYEKVMWYYDKYKTCPDITFMKSIRRDRNDRIIVKRLMRRREIKEDYIREHLEVFVRRNMFVDIYQKTGKLYNQQKQEDAYQEMFGGMQEIFNVSMNEDQYEFLLKDFEKRYSQREIDLQSSRSFRIPTGIRCIDKVIGGVGNGEVFFWMGDAKSGKSFALTHCGAHAVKRYIPTLHVFLEGRKQQNYDRYDACFMGALYNEVRSGNIPPRLYQKMLKIANKRKYRDLIMKHVESYDACDIIDIERDLHTLRRTGYDIKLVVIDYFDLLRSRKNYRSDEERHRQAQNARDLKTFAVRNNVAVMTATQTNRYIDVDDPNFLITSKNVAEDYSKIRALDILVTINKTHEESKAKKCRLWVDTVRDNPGGRLFRVNQDLDHSRFYVRKEV